MVDIKNAPMAREQLEIASQTATDAPVNGLEKVDPKLFQSITEKPSKSFTPPSFRGHFSSPLRYATAVLVVGALGLIACSPQAQAGERPTVPEATASAFAELNPNPNTVNIPIVGQPEVGKPDPAPLPSSETKPQTGPEATAGLPDNAPIEIKQVYNRLEELTPKLTDPSAAKMYAKSLVDAATFTSTKLSPALIENTKAGLYFGTYSQIVGQYYATRDLEVLALAKQLREFIKETYPEKYKTIERTNGWEIKE